MKYTAKMIELKELRVLYSELKKANDVKDLLLEEWAMREADNQQQIKELQKLLRRVSMIYPQWRNEIKQALKR